MSKYAVFVQESYTQVNDYDRHLSSYEPTYSVNYTAVEKFDTLEQLEKWVLRNSEGYNKKKFEVVRYETLDVSLKVVVNIDTKGK